MSHRRRLLAGLSSVLCVLAVSISPLSGQRGRRTETVDGREAAAGEMLVKFRRALSSDELTQLRIQTDTDRVDPIGSFGVRRFHSRSIHAQALKDFLRTHPDVEYAEPNYLVHTSSVPNDPSFSNLWGLRNLGQVINGIAGTPGADISATSAWDVSTGSVGNVVGVVDSGINYNHPDLVANVWSAPTAFTITFPSGRSLTCAAGTHGYNAITRSCDPNDDNGHGSHTSGTIGARGNNSKDVVGVNWTTRIMGLKFLDNTGVGWVSDAIDAIEFAVRTKAFFSGTGAANVRVLSNSWGGEGFSQTLFDEINKAGDNDMLFVAAAGNAGQNNDTALSPLYPASYNLPNIVTVAATDSNDQLAGFSNYGRNSVHLGAPGSNVLSTILSISTGYASGTSMATPHVSGAAMLVLSACPLTTAQLKATLLGTVDPLGALTGTTLSGGRLNVNRAIRSCAVPIPQAFGKLSPGNRAQGMPINGTISWLPSPGATSYEYCVDTTANAACDSGWAFASGTSATPGGLAVATTYYWQVRARNGVGSTPADGGIWWSFTTPPTSESWFGPNWSYRRAIAITNNTGSTLSDYQALITLDSSFDFTKASPNGADLRITDASATLALPFWIEAWNATSRRARIWVRVPSVTTTGTTLYLYYGNSSVTIAGNAESVFDVYDGFESLNVGDRPAGGDSIQWVTNAAVSAVSSPVRQGIRSIRNHTATTAAATFNAANQGVVGAWMRRASTGVGDSDIYLYVGDTLLATIGLGGSGRLHYWDGSFHDTAVAWSANTWYLVTATFDTTQHRFEYTVYDEGLTQIVKVSNIAFANQATGLTTAVLYTSSAFLGDAYADDFRVVRWTGAEATNVVGAEQVHGGNPGLPGAFAKASPANGASGQALTATVTWGASSGATSYEYCVDTSANAACNTNWVATPNLSVPLSGLAAGTTYSWQVRAVNGAGTTLADGGGWWTFTTQTASQGGWLDPAWAYRRPITIANAAGSTLSNYQVAVSLDSSSFDFTHAQPDGRDVRVTDATGTALLPFWVEVWDAATLRATVWVKVPSVPAAGTTLYLYSGNGSAAAAGNASATFEVYDGFEALAVGAPPAAGTGVTWSLGGGAVAAVSSPVRQGVRALQQTNHTLTFGSSTPIGQGTVGAWLRRQSASGGDDDIYLYGNGGLLATIGLGGSGRLHYFDGTFHDTAVNWTANTWYFVSARFDAPQHRFTFTVFDATLVPVVTVPNVALAGSTPVIDTAMLYTSSAFAGPAYADDFHVTRWTGAETTSAIGSEEHGGTPPPPPPGGFGKLAPANGASGQPLTATVTWGVSSGATSYEYCVDTSANAACNTNWVATPNLSVPLSGLAAGTTYSWQVRAVNGAGTTLADGGGWWTFTTQTASQGGWLDPAWAYRRPVTIANGTGSTLSNYQVAVSLDSSSFDFTHAQPDGRDVRVTDATGTALLPFWVEVWDAATLRATVWVKVPSVPAAGTTLYLYSGNGSAAAAGNASATFEVYDGFEALAVGAPPAAGTGVTWSLGGGAVAAVSSPVRQGVRALQQTNHTLTFGSSTPIGQGTVGAWLRRQSASGGDDDIYLYGNGGLLATIGLGGSGRLHYFDGTFHDTAVNWTANTWYFVSARFDAPQHRFTFTVFDATLVPVVTVPNVALAGSTPVIDTAMLYTSSAFAGPAYADDFHVTRWTGAETTFTIGPEQTP